MISSAVAVGSSDLDAVRLNFSPSTLTLLDVVLAAIMFGIALDTKFADFAGVVKMPKAMAVGIAAQFLVLPAVTLALTVVLNVRASAALGMILVACCPPGSISNVLTHRAGGNVALSVSMTAISNMLAIFLLPLGIAFWGSRRPATDAILTAVDLSALSMLRDTALIIGIPFVAGIVISQRFSGFAAAAQPWVKRISLLALLVFIVSGLAGNSSTFVDYIGLVFLAVLLQGLLALLLGYSIATWSGLEMRNRKSVTFEVGVRNAGLGLGMVFSFFGGIGGMAMVAGWWGIWDLITGLLLASWWARRGLSAGLAPS